MNCVFFFFLALFQQVNEMRLGLLLQSPIDLESIY